MPRDIRELFKDEIMTHEKMPENHQERFLQKLNEALPEKKSSKFTWIGIAASTVVLIGLSIGFFKYMQTNTEVPTHVAATEIESKTLGDISPGLKKVEDYYLANINLELSKLEYTPETKEVFDGYFAQLDELNKEYKRLSTELTQSGPSELTVNALIDNLKFRLNLLYRLRAQLKELNPSNLEEEASMQSI